MRDPALEDLLIWRKVAPFGNGLILHFIIKQWATKNSTIMLIWTVGKVASSYIQRILCKFLRIQISWKQHGFSEFHSSCGLNKIVRESVGYFQSRSVFM
jgi:hypothetical protein